MRGHNDRDRFAVTRLIDGGLQRNIARVTCMSCGAHADRNLTGQMNPEMVAKDFRRLGWECDHHRPSRSRCPECLKPKPQPAPRATQPPRPYATEIPMNTKPQAASTDARDPTPDQKRLIREKLDGSFDERRGAYLDGYSDQKIGAELNVPWAWVTKLREAAYGTIRVDPAIAELQAAAAELRNAINATAQDLSIAHQRLSSQLTLIEKRLAEYEKGRAA